MQSQARNISVLLRKVRVLLRDSRLVRPAAVRRDLKLAQRAVGVIWEEKVPYSINCLPQSEIERAIAILYHNRYSLYFPLYLTSRFQSLFATTTSVSKYSLQLRYPNN